MRFNLIFPINPNGFGGDNPLEQIESKGMMATGKNPKTGLVEIIELKNHPWFVGVQFHPEYKSTVLKPQPLFVEFIQAALLKKNNK